MLFNSLSTDLFGLTRLVSDQCSALFVTPVCLASIVCVCVCVCVCMWERICTCACQHSIALPPTWTDRKMAEEFAPTAFLVLLLLFLRLPTCVCVSVHVCVCARLF